MLLEELGGLQDSELFEPLADHVFDHVSVECLDLIFVGKPVVDLFVDRGLSLHQVLLKPDPLSNDVALHGLVLHLLKEVDSLLFSLYLFLPDEVLSPLSNGIHEIWLQKVVVVVELEALVKKFGVYFVRQTHQTDSLILDLRNQSFVVLVLGCNQLSQEVLAIGFGDSLRLVIEDICQVIMILLLGSPHLNERQHQHSRREKNGRGRWDTSHILEDSGVLAFDLFEVNSDWVEAVINVIFVSVTPYI